MVFQFLSPVGHKFFCWNCAGIVHGSRIGCQNGGANSDFLHSSENGVLVAVDFPAGSFAKISNFFPSDLSKWNLGENFGFIKFKIFEWKLVFPLIFADDFFKIFHSRIFWNCVGGISFSDKLGGIAGDFIFGVRHFFFSGDNFLKMTKEKILRGKKGNES